MGNFFTKKRPYEYERELRALNDPNNKELLNDFFLKNYRINLPKGQKTTAKKMLSIHNDKIFPIYIPGKHIKIDRHLNRKYLYLALCR